MKRKLKIIILTIMLIILVYLFCMFCVDYVINSRDNKLKDSIVKANRNISYVIVEINPKVILELVDNKIENIGCLNEDCKTIFKDINIISKNLKEGIAMLYNKALDEKIDFKKVVISSYDDISTEIEEIDYINYKKITKEEEKEYINAVLDNDTIKNETHRKNVTNELLNLYKKDKDYGVYYTCSNNDNELSCFITEEFALKLGSETDSLSEIYDSIKQLKKLEGVFDKFNIIYNISKVEGMDINSISSIYINNWNYKLFLGTCYANTIVDINNGSNTVKSCYNNAGVLLKQNKDYEEYRYEILPFSKFDLVSKTYNEKDVIILNIDETTHKLATSNK